ncbi:hypothetical protein ZIOFF_050973 [Zingiber officinale]|uniref:HMA domain-containing protein n=1 Tax=Zingiber officinale TaxID=94328 RepID=A0A8J5FJR6_ZINOF|nr:hypothetical protein ZIOFF_050973 [Zingiber officinale]
MIELGSLDHLRAPPLEPIQSYFDVELSNNVRLDHPQAFGSLTWLHLDEPLSILSLFTLRCLDSDPLPVSRRAIRAVAKEDQAAATVLAEATKEDEEATLAVPVSPSDLLTMHFQAEGTMDESAIPSVSKALQGSEGTSDASVRVDEGIAIVELTKQTTVQATGVASNLVEIIQGVGFKLQSLNLSFVNKEDAATDVG